MRGKKVVFVVCFVTCCLVAVGIWGARVFQRAQVAKATDVALRYVEKRYPFDIECVGGEYSFELSLYYINFKTIGHEPLHFTVLVQPDFEISEERYTSSGAARLVADNYLHRKFEKEAKTYIENVLREGYAPADILAYCNNSALYAYSLPADVNETSSLDELLQKMDFNVVLYYDATENIQLENVETILQEHGVHARDIWIRRQGDGSSVFQSPTHGNTRGRFFCVDNHFTPNYTIVGGDACAEESKRI